MPRPPKHRNVEQMPAYTLFKPAGVPARQLGEVLVTIDEFEALRLKDLVGWDQEQCAQSMGVSQSTLQRILTAARAKITQALVEGKAIRIEGGPVSFDPDQVGGGQGGSPRGGAEDSTPRGGAEGSRAGGGGHGRGAGRGARRGAGRGAGPGGEQGAGRGAGPGPRQGQGLGRGRGQAGVQERELDGRERGQGKDPEQEQSPAGDF